MVRRGRASPGLVLQRAVCLTIEVRAFSCTSWVFDDDDAHRPKRAAHGSRPHQRSRSRTLWPRSMPRVVPLTDALFAALREARHLRGDYVLYGNDGRPATTFSLRTCSRRRRRPRAFSRPEGSTSFAT